MRAPVSPASIKNRALPNPNQRWMSTSKGRRYALRAMTRALDSVTPVERHAQIARSPVVTLTIASPIQAGEILFIGQVAQLAAHRPLAIQRIAGHQIHQGVGLLA